MAIETPAVVRPGTVVDEGVSLTHAQSTRR